MVPAVVLGDPVVMVVVMVSGERDSGAADRERQRCDSGHDPPACSRQHRVILFIDWPRRSTAQAPDGMGLNVARLNVTPILAAGTAPVVGLRADLSTSPLGVASAAESGGA
jgi:hypothetical protein